MNAINISLAIRNNILHYMRKVMWPVTQADILDHCDLPKLHGKNLNTAVNRAFIALRASGEVVGMPIEGAGNFEAKLKYRLAGPLDPAPKAIKTYAARGTGEKARAATSRLQKLQAEANAIAAQIQAKQAEEAKKEERPATYADVKETLFGAVTPSSPDNSPSDDYIKYRSKSGYETHNLGAPLTGTSAGKKLAGVDVQVTPEGLTIRIGSINVTIKAG